MKAQARIRYVNLRLSFMLAVSLVALILSACTGWRVTPPNPGQGGQPETQVVLETEPPVTPTSASTPTTRASIASPTTDTPVTPGPAASETPAPLPSPTLASTTTAPTTPPEPLLFDVSWDDRSVFQEGLISIEDEAAHSMPGASIYHLEIRIAEDLASLQGREEVYYTNREETSLDQVYFRLYPNLLGGSVEISELALNGTPTTPRYELSDTALSVPLEAPLDPGQSLVISMNFDVEVPQSAEGNYGSFALLDNILALAHFYPFIPVYDDEEWNVEIPAESGDIIYGDSSFYRVRVIAPPGVVVAGSGMTIEQAPGDGEQQVTLAAGPVRDFYLAASPDYISLSETVGETTINHYARESFLPAAEEGLASAVAAVEIFNDRVGPYPFTELDIVPTPNLALGIEYPGIVAMTTRLYDPAGPGSMAGAPGFLESTIAHEVAHQWFYSVVGNDQLDEPWLDESLVQHLTWLYFRDRYGDADAGTEGFHASLTGRWDRVGREEIPIGRPVRAYDPEEYGAIIYGRGPLFFEALTQLIGETTFGTLLESYFEQYKYEIATTEGFRDLAEEHCGCDLSALFEEWVYD